ncbi:hypothetical protein AN641_06555 [Candidatus Epulonipiscioides gigas]|nr:hypothetical protein AN641_06555 [Epulopiscium sp. SCG-C07WGA-EpuloA2]
MNNDMKLYYDYTISPLGQLYYQTVWHQLSNIKHKKILDFGSGFAFNSNFLAKDNEVIALERDAEMIEIAKNNGYCQIHGDLTALKDMEDETFDIIICHLVFEFADNAQEILCQLIRVLKKDGFISIVRHNRNGRIIQSIVQDYDLNEADKLLKGEYSYSSAFGDIKYYDNQDIINWSKNQLYIQTIYGVRALASLHPPEIQAKENWIQDMLKLELELLKNQDFIKIAYFNHLILTKYSKA